MKSLNDMIAYHDTETEHDTRYEVVSYLLAHLRELDHLSLSEVARATYVSKSTVSRVVRRFGFESYDEFLAVSRRLVKQDPSVTLRITPDELVALKTDVDDFIEPSKVCDGIQHNGAPCDDAAFVFSGFECRVKRSSYYFHQ